MIDKNTLKQLLEEGKSTRHIAKILGCDKTTVGSYIHKYGLVETSTFYPPKKSFKINKIDSKEKAYMLGFILADGHIDSNNKSTELAVALMDREIIDFICSILDSEINISTKLNKKKRIFPKARTSRTISDIIQFTGGRLKKDRHYPRVPVKYERYLLQGFFDGDGCITWGEKKTRKGIWQKVSFTSQLKLLEGVQKMLINNLNISTVIRPKTDGDCYVLEFACRENVLKFLDYLYADNDIIVLRRKYNKYKALRLELEEFGER